MTGVVSVPALLVAMYEAKMHVGIWNRALTKGH